MKKATNKNQGNPDNLDKIKVQTKATYNPDVLSCLANLSNDEVFTPPAIVNQMLDLLPVELWQDKNATFLDPVCKSGVFLREITKRLNEGLKKQIPDQQKRINHILTKQVFGIALTELTALLSRRTLYCTKTADSKYSVCTEFDSEQGNLFYKKTQHKWQNDKCVFCGASQSVYDRDDALETYAYPFIHENNPFKKMKFDVIIGNPPYQLNDGGAGASAMPIYQKFVEQAMKLKPQYLSMIIPSRWFAGGKGLDDFRDKMLNDKSMKFLNDFMNAKECFPGVSLGGGVCYFLWDRDYKGDCEVINTLNGNSSRSKRRLNEFDIFIRDNKAIDIVKKINSKSKNNISEYIESRNPFGLPSSARGEDFPTKDKIVLHSSKGIGYIENKSILQGHKYISKYKVMFSKVTSEHAGEPDKLGMFRVLSTIKVLPPNEVCTDSYLIAGPFDSKEIADNFIKYVTTKFARYLLLQAVTSINLSKDKFVFIPKVDFTESWTDEKLYKRYGITKGEIAFIESMIKPMEL